MPLSNSRAGAPIQAGERCARAAPSRRWLPVRAGAAFAGALLLLLFAPGAARADVLPPQCFVLGESLELEVGDLATEVAMCFDDEFDDLTITITQPPQKGTAEVVRQGRPDAAVQYSASEVGSDSFTFKANDGTSDSDEVTITIENVPAVNDPPECFELIGLPIEVGVPASAPPCFDVEGDDLTITITQAPQKGTLEVVDQGSPAPMLTYTATAIGDDSFAYKANDGNLDSDEATTTTHNFDSTAPETTIDAGPTGVTTDATPTFRFSSNEAGASFDCRVDGGQWAACTSPKTLAAVNQGPHDFEVRARDAAGNVDPSPARRPFSVAAPVATAAPDVTPPTLALGHARTQKVGKSIRLVVTAVSEDLWASLTGRVSVPGVSRPYRLKGIKDQRIARGSTSTLKAKVPRKGLAAIRRALDAHKKVKSTLRLKVHDAAGNVAKRKVTIKLKH